jgi:hypothetical protein
MISAESEIGARVRIWISRAVKEGWLCVPPPNVAHSCARLLLVYFGPLIAFGALAIVALGFGVLLVALQLLAALLKHAGI